MKNIQLTARLAGLAYLLLTPFGAFAMLYVPSTLFVSGDITTTISNIAENQLLFRLASVAVFITQLINLIVVYLLFQLLQNIKKTAAWLMVGFIMLGVPIAWLNELNFVAVLHIINSDNVSPNLIAMFLDMREYGISIAGIFWGLWLFPMGYLVFKSGFMPKIIGILLMIGCFGYLADSFIYFIDPKFPIKFAEFLFLGEIAILLWLLIMGVNVKKWHALNQAN